MFPHDSSDQHICDLQGLTTLLLSGNKLGDDGLDHLAEALKINRVRDMFGICHSSIVLSVRRRS